MRTVYVAQVETDDAYFDYAVHQTMAGAEASLRAIICNQLQITQASVQQMTVDDLIDYYADETDGYQSFIGETPVLP